MSSKIHRIRYNQKKLGKFWSARVGLSHRALAIEDGEGFLWVWIGPHDEYERLIP